MGRAKVEMEFITKEKTRNTTYEKRKNGLIKKANEFTILCDVNTAVIIYPPNSNTPEIWPENPDQIKKSIASYKAKDENGKRNYGTKEYFEERKKKMDDQLVKARKRNMEARYATWFDELDGLSEGQLRHFAMGLENKENTVREYLESRKRIRFQPAVNYNQVQVVNDHLMNMNHGNGVGWFDGAATTSFVPLEGEVGGYGYNPMFESGMVYGNYPNNPWLFQLPVVQCGLMPDLGLMQDFDSQVMNSGVGGFVMDDYRGRFMG